MRPPDGITVALEQAIAGPFCTRQLADMGARVISMASHFVWCNRSKKGLTPDLKHPCGPFLAGDVNTVMLGLQNEREWVAFCEQVLDLPVVQQARATIPE